MKISTRRSPKDVLPASWSLPLTVLTAAVVVRVAFFLAYFHAEPPPAADSSLYLNLAQNLAAGEGFSRYGEATAVVPPLYPAVLAPFYALGLSEVWTATVLGIAMSSMTSVVVALTARRIWGPRTGWVAGILAATLPTTAFWAPYALTDTLAVLVLAAAAWALVRPGEEISRGQAAAGGALLGLALLTRPAAVPLLAALLLWLLMRRVAPDRWRTAGVVVLAMAVVVAPWAVRNASHSDIDRPYPSSSFGGQNAWVAVHWTPDGRGTIGVDVPPYPRARAPESEARTDDRLRMAARAHLRRSPARYKRGLIEKPRLIWPLHVSGVSVGRSLAEAWLTLLGFLAIGGFLVSAWVRRGGAWWLMLAAGVTISAAITYVDFDLRYRLPLLLCVTPPAAATLVAMAEARTKRRAPDGQLRAVDA